MVHMKDVSRLFRYHDHLFQQLDDQIRDDDQKLTTLTEAVV